MAVAGVAVAGCGAGAHLAAAPPTTTPAALVSQAVSASSAVDSGRIDLTLALTLDGVKELGGKPLTIDVSGPFARAAGGQTSADLSIAIAAAADKAQIGVDIVDGTVYLGLGGTFYKLGAAASHSPPAPVGGASGPWGMLRALGIEPRSWLSDPHVAGGADVGGVPTRHLTAQVNVTNVVRDVAKLITHGTSGLGATGATGASSLSGALAAIESAITSARVDIYTGIADHIVRRFGLAIAFTVPASAAGAAGDLTGGELDLDATLTELGRPQSVTAPASWQPQSRLLNGVLALESQFGSLAGWVGGLGSHAGRMGLFGS